MASLSEPKTLINKLTNDVYPVIWDFLTDKEYATVPLVSRAWRDLQNGNPAAVAKRRMIKLIATMTSQLEETVRRAQRDAVSDNPPLLELRLEQQNSPASQAA